MNEKLHIIITADHGKTLRIPCSKKKLTVYGAIAGSLALFLVITSLFSISLFTRNRTMGKELADLQYTAENSEAIIAEYQRKADEELLQLNLELASLKLESANQLAAYKEEKESKLNEAVSELEIRSQQIENLMANLGLKTQASIKKIKRNDANKGGPFIPDQEESHRDLIEKTDHYLKKIRTLPLGRPVTGPITSRFGKRSDPVNKKKSFHEGIDFRGKRGEKIFATADGVVKKAFKNGSYGNYVEIDHGNGYLTAFAHMQNYTVSKGEKVKRGQLIGQVGNTGRSTGPHLHYEVLLDKKPVNPLKFMQVAKLITPPKKASTKE